jgi:hypothetical protein
MTDFARPVGLLDSRGCSRNNRMPMNKPHLKFTRIDMAAGWATPEGHPAGVIVRGARVDRPRSSNSATTKEHQPPSGTLSGGQYLCLCHRLRASSH